MNLREVREACVGCSDTMSQYILATVDPSPDLPITADWLREEWGFKKAEWSRRIAYENGHAIMLNVYDNCWNYEDDNFEWPHKLTTRQQFADLARCLGIPRRKDGAR